MSRASQGASRLDRQRHKGGSYLFTLPLINTCEVLGYIFLRRQATALGDFAGKAFPKQV